MLKSLRSCKPSPVPLCQERIQSRKLWYNFLLALDIGKLTEYTNFELVESSGQLSDKICITFVSISIKLLSWSFEEFIFSILEVLKRLELKSKDSLDIDKEGFDGLEGVGFDGVFFLCGFELFIEKVDSGFEVFEFGVVLGVLGKKFFVSLLKLF